MDMALYQWLPVIALLIFLDFSAILLLHPAFNFGAIISGSARAASG